MNTKKLRIMAPGPVEIPASVRTVAALPGPHHRTVEFQNAFKEALDGMKRVFDTTNHVITFACSGTGAMESCVVNLFSPGDEVLVTVCGNFSERWAEICQTYGLDVHKLEFVWGEPVEPAVLEAELKKYPGCAGVFTIFSETSTGVENDIEAIGKVVAKTEAILVVDGVSGVAALPFHMDAWNVDALAVGSQKGLMIPPGLGFASISPKARKRIAGSKIPKFYFSFEKAIKVLEKGPLPDSPFTPAVSLILQLRESLRLLDEEGMENVWRRGATLGEATRAAVKALGLKLLVSRNVSNVVTAVDCANGPDPSKVVKGLRDKYGISIIGGQGKLRGKIFRIGHVGNVDEIDVLGTIAALEMVLSEMGHPIKAGAGVAAAEEVFLKAAGGKK